MNPDETNMPTDVPVNRVESEGRSVDSPSGQLSFSSQEMAAQNSVTQSADNISNSPTTTATNAAPKPLVSSSAVAMTFGMEQEQQCSSNSSKIKYLTPPPLNVGKKRIIRKMTLIDPKKLQQSGLDRKIAEALSKQKSQKTPTRSLERGSNEALSSASLSANCGVSNAVPAASTSFKPLPAKKNTEVSPLSAKPVLPTKTFIPPKITITAPADSSPEVNIPNNVRLDSQQRLVHVKNLLNKKLLLKKNLSHKDVNVKQYDHLKPPAPPIKFPTRTLDQKETPTSANNDNQLYEHLKAPPPVKGHLEQIKLPTRQSVQKQTPPPKPPHMYEKLKESELSTPTLKPTKAKTPQKSPQDIARKLDFHTEMEAGAAGEMPKGAHVKCLNRDSQQSLDTPQSYRMFQTNPAMPVKITYPTMSNLSPDFNHIPKASIKPGNIQQDSISFSDSPQGFRPYAASHVSQSNEIPKASIKAGYSLQHVTPVQYIPPQIYRPYSQTIHQTIHQPIPQMNQRSDYPNEMPSKVSYSNSMVSQAYQNDYMKQQRMSFSKSSHPNFNDMPKTFNKTGNNQSPLSYAPYSYKQLKLNEQKIDFPEVSPLKVPFPTVNVPKETPLPAIDSFKKPYPTVNAVYYDLQHQVQIKAFGQQCQFESPNYESSIFPQHPLEVVNSSLISMNLTPTTETRTEEANKASITSATSVTPSNSLIVLENKVLSQDEMIDLTELRLSTTNTPRFINPHKPIPEVVIKQENADEYPGTNSPPTLSTTTEQTKEEVVAEKPKVVTNTSTEKLVISTMHNKKIIINAQKLKLPPEQLADLAKKIKQKTAGILTSTKDSCLVNKTQEIRILNTKASSGKITTKHTAYVLPNNNNNNNKNNNEKESLELTRQSPGNKIVIQNKAISKEFLKVDHNYQIGKTTKSFKDNQNCCQTPSAKKTITEGLENTLTQTPKTYCLKNIQQSETSAMEEPEVSFNSDKYLEMHSSSYMDSSFSTSAVEIIDEPMESEDCFSAVDFIASLNDTHPITEETSLELSPEELNLNASCAMNLSPLRIQSYPPRHKPYSPLVILNDKTLKSQEMNTIVIESSKGPETILTTESPNKYGELQKVKRIKKLSSSDMDIEKPLGQTNNHSQTHPPQLVVEPLKEPRNIDLTDVIVANDPDKINLIIEQIEENSREISLEAVTESSDYKTQSPFKDLKENSPESAGDFKISDVKTPIKVNNVTEINENFKDTAIEDENVTFNLHPEILEGCKDSSDSDVQIIETKESKNLVNLKSPTKENVLNKDSINEAEEKTNKKSSSIKDDEVISENAMPEPVKDFVVNKTTEPDKQPISIDSSNSNETPASNAVTSRRISKFKKGKINLVQRNKAGPSTNKPIITDKNNENQRKPVTGETNKANDSEIRNRAEKSKNETSKVVSEEVSKEIDLIPKVPINVLSSPQKTKSQNLEACNTVQQVMEKVNQKSYNIDDEIPKASIQVLPSPLKSSSKSPIKSKELQEIIDLIDEETSTETSEEQLDICQKQNTTDAKGSEATSIYNNRDIQYDDHDYSRSSFKSPQIAAIEEEQEKDNSEVTAEEDASKIELSYQDKSPENAKNELPTTPTKVGNANQQICAKSSETQRHFQSDKKPDEDSISEKSPEEFCIPESPAKQYTESPLRQRQIQQADEIIAETSSGESYVPESPEKFNPSKWSRKYRQLRTSLEGKKIREDLEKSSISDNSLIAKGDGKVLSDLILDDADKLEISAETKSSEVQQTKEASKTNCDIEETQEQSSIKPLTSNISAEIISQKSLNVLQNPESLETNVILDNIENMVCANITPPSIKLNKNQDSKAILTNIRNVRVSLIDIVKHSPSKSPEIEPVLPFKKKTNDTSKISSETKGIKTLLKQLRSHNKETDEEEHLEQKKDKAKAKESKEVSNIIANARSRRSRGSETQTPPPPPLVTKQTSNSARKRHSNRPLISDDDLEFLPVNAEVKFKLSESKDKEIKSDVSLKSAASTTCNRRTRLYSKPLEMELSKQISPRTKRTRYYSQTLETNVTISFDTSKPIQIPPSLPSPLPKINFKPLETEDSCRDSTQDSTTEPITYKQRKKLRKTLEDIKKSQKSVIDTDTDEDDNRDFDDCCLNGGEDSNEFLGFEENSETPKKPYQQHGKSHKYEQDKVTKTKGGTLKNWLTTGKAISPTSEREIGKRMRHDKDVALTKSPVIDGRGGLVSKPLKKRWDLKTTRQEETDITDDTSPADDEDESGVLRHSISSSKRSKRGIKNVIDSDKELLDSKKIKLNESLEKQEEHSFIKPRHLRTISKNSGTDSECHEDKTGRIKRPLIRVKNFQEDLYTKVEEKANQLKKTESESLTENSATDSDCPGTRQSGRRRKGEAKDMDKLEENSGPSNSYSEKREARKNNVERNKAIEEYSEKHSDLLSRDSDGSSKAKIKAVINDVEDNTDCLKGKKTAVIAEKKEKPSNLTSKVSDSTENAKNKANADDEKKNLDKICKSHEKLESKGRKSLSKTEDVDASSKSPYNDCGNNDKAKLKSKTKVEITQKTNTDKDSKENFSGHVDDNMKHLKSSLDKSLKDPTSDPETPKGTKSKRSKSKQNKKEEDLAKNLDISKSQQHEKTKENPKVKTADKDQDTQNIALSETPKSAAAVKKESKLLNIDETPQTSKKAKRGRKPKIKNEETPQTPANQINKSSLKRLLSRDTSDDEGPTTSSKRRTNKNPAKRKCEIEDSDSISATTTPLKQSTENDSMIHNVEPITTPHLSLIDNETPKSGGRKRTINLTESNFNPRLLLITSRDKLETDEVLTDSGKGEGPIQCGLCLAHTTREKWSSHLAEHYGVGWKVGKEQELNIENRSVVLACISKYLKKSSSKGLTCRMCKKTFRSALGVIIHLETCGAEVIRVLCEYCKRDFAKYSLPSHLKLCHVRNHAENEEVKQKESHEKREEVFGNTGRLKRNSTLKAESKLKTLGIEMDNLIDNAIKADKQQKTTETDKSEVDPKSRIRYVPPLSDDFRVKLSEDIQKLGGASCPEKRCRFSSYNMPELEEHLKKCKLLLSGYICNLCRRRPFETEQEAIDHVVKEHPYGRSRKKSEDPDCDIKSDGEDFSSDDSYVLEGEEECEQEENEATDQEHDIEEECDNQKKGSKKKKTKARNANQNFSQSGRKRVFGARTNDLNRPVLRKWKNFIQLNHSSVPLFGEFTTNYIVLNFGDYKKYLPTQTHSMKFNFKDKADSPLAPVGQPDKDIEWSQVERYKNIHEKKDTFYFLGAPVKLCSWLPLPDHTKEQYLTVVYRQDMFKYIKMVQPKQHHTIILILKLRQIDTKYEFNIHYGLVINDGPVHHLSFLPSGGYDKSSNRLGLVAVGTINSSIKIYSLPINVETASNQESSKNNENITLIEIKPSFILNIDIMADKQNDGHVLLNTQCLQICWSEFSGHQHIFASFSNGCIGIWDISNDDQQNLNRFVDDDVVKYAPLNYFYAGEKGIKCFALHYDTSGPRWLGLSGAYRKFVVYDIKCFMLPVVMREEVNKNILTSMDWCPLWENVLYSYCDTIPNNGRCAMSFNPSNVMFTQNKLDYMASGVAQVHYTPLVNMGVCAMDNGDLVFLDTRELHYECPVGKPFGERRMLYTMDLKQLNGEPLIRLTKGQQKNGNAISPPSEWIMQDPDYKEKYGLVFNSIIKLKDTDKNSYLNEQRCPPLNCFAYMRINTLRCNLNLNAKNLIALGYENGFLRLVNFNKEAVFKS